MVHSHGLVSALQADWVLYKFTYIDSQPFMRGDPADPLLDIPARLLTKLDVWMINPLVFIPVQAQYRG